MLAPRRISPGAGGVKGRGVVSAGDRGAGGLGGRGGRRGRRGADAQGLPGAEDTSRGTTAPGANVTWRLKPSLCFGAVDWSARVWVNGRFVGEHIGGYTPFELDLSRYVRPGKPATLTVRAWDACDADTLLGKQTEDWYTHSGGIWQTVWLEGRPAAHITHIHVTPDVETGEALFAVSVAGAEGRPVPGQRRLSRRRSSRRRAYRSRKARATVYAGGQGSHPRLWSPEHPHLYDCLVRLTPERTEERRGG